MSQEQDLVLPVSEQLIDPSEAAATTNPLPRKIGPDLYWLGECFVFKYQGQPIHSYNSAFLIVGEKHSALIETGVTGQREAILAQLEALLATGIPAPRYLFVTHCEMSHTGSAGLILERFPEATMHGEVTDMHLVYPQFEDRIFFEDPGTRFDLGGREVVVVEGVFRDLLYSRWYFDTGSKGLFVGDGFAYSHWHQGGSCGCFAEEAKDLDITAQMQRYGFSAFHWTQFVDVEPYIARLDWLIDELGCEIIAPTHGLPIGDVEATMPDVRAGFRAMQDHSALPQE